MTSFFNYFGAKGGQGTTTVAATTAVLAAKAGRRTLLIDRAEHHDCADVLGIPRPTEARTYVIDRLDLIEADAVPTSLLSEYDVVVVDHGTRVQPGGTLVLRNCYLALARSKMTPAANAVLLAEPGRALLSRDITDALGVPLLAELPVDPSIARTIDSGTLASRPPRTLSVLAPATV